MAYCLGYSSLIGDNAIPSIYYFANPNTDKKVNSETLFVLIRAKSYLELQK